MLPTLIANLRCPAHGQHSLACGRHDRPQSPGGGIGGGTEVSEVDDPIHIGDTHRPALFDGSFLLVVRSVAAAGAAQTIKASSLPNFMGDRYRTDRSCVTLPTRWDGSAALYDCLIFRRCAKDSVLRCAECRRAMTAHTYPKPSRVCLFLLPLPRRSLQVGLRRLYYRQAPPCGGDGRASIGGGLRTAKGTETAPRWVGPHDRASATERARGSRNRDHAMAG
jgi:hypothetical protein